MKTYTVLSAVIGECCSEPHIQETKMIVKTPEEAVEKTKAKLEAKGFDVGSQFPCCNLQRLVEAVETSLSNMQDTEQDINEETGEELADVKEMRLALNAVKKRGL